MLKTKKKGPVNIIRSLGKINSKATADSGENIHLESEAGENETKSANGGETEAFLPNGGRD